MTHLLCAALLALCASAACALEKITPQAFLDLVTGRTATFVTFRERNLVGVEQFISRAQTKWTRQDGSCTYGSLSIDGHALCFLYDDQPSRPYCWVPYRQGDDLFVMYHDGSDIQAISALDDTPVQCFDVPLS